MLTDLSLERLRQYHSSSDAPDDFDQFWADTLAQTRQAGQGSRVQLDRLDLALGPIDIYDLTFPGYNGEPIKAWLRMPADLTEPAPSIVHYVGYNGGRGHPLDNLVWAASGYVECQMDNRGQGSGWSRGATPDPAGSGPAIAGFMTKGIASPQTYYYRRLMSDAVRCVEAVASLEMVDANRLAVYGGSQGGGLALAAAALSELPKAVIAEVPFLADFRRGVVMTDEEPFAEITHYLAIHHGHEDTVYHTLSYFDAANLAARATVPAHFTVGLMDTTVPPSTVFAAYNAYAGPKEIRIWPHNGHEGGGPDDIMEGLEFLSQHL